MSCSGAGSREAAPLGAGWVLLGAGGGSGRAQGEKKRPSCHPLRGDIPLLGRKLLLRGCSQAAFSRMKPGRGGAGSDPLPCGSVRESPAVGALLRAIQRKKGKKNNIYCGSEGSSQPKEVLCLQENLRAAGGLLPEHKKMDFMGRARGPHGHPSPRCEKGGCGMAP